MANNAYDCLSEWFEYLNSDCDYEKWSQYLILRLNELGATGGSGIDIGCGTGVFTRALRSHGYDMTGVDCSEGMLARAQATSSRCGKINYVLADVTKLKTLERCDFAVCVNDCLNYVSAKKLPTAFKKVYGALKKGALFQFDVSTEYKLKNVLANNTFAEDYDELSYIWFNVPFCEEGESGVKMDVTMFSRRADGLFERKDEKHIQYAHSEADIESALNDAGFIVIKKEGHLGASLSETSLRINYFCKRA